VERRLWLNVPLGAVTSTIGAWQLDFPSPFAVFAVLAGIALALTALAPERPLVRLRGRSLSWRDAAYPGLWALLALLLAAATVTNAADRSWLEAGEAALLSLAVGALAAFELRRFVAR
jgi:hypothetical protein